MLILASAYERKSRAPARDSLLLESELLHDRAVTALVVLLEIAEMRTAISDHLEKTAAGMEILLVLLEMGRELVDLAAKDSHLDVGRAGILVVACRSLDDGGLYSFRKH